MNQRSEKKRVNAPKEAVRRILLIKIVFIGMFSLVAARLFQIQALDAGRYQEAAQRQYEVNVELQASRGRILDRAGKDLVSNTTAISIAADPRMLGNNITPVARLVGAAFGKPTEHYLRKLRPKNSNFVWLERLVDDESVSMIRPHDFEGMITLREPKRVYHFGTVAGQVLGFTDRDGKGISGVELQFDRYLSGTNGREVRQRDGLGRARPAVEYPRIEPTNGSNVLLTIDAEYQAIAEEALKSGIEEYDAESGLVTMLDPGTGEVLAMANYPRLKPDQVGRDDQALTRNRIVTDMFEPGSVFKIVTVAAALEHLIVSPDEKFYAEKGKYRVELPRGRSRTITDMEPYGTITFRDAMVLSSNIVMAKASDQIGSEKLYRTARDFGFGTESGVELPGEIGGELKKPTAWSGTTLNSMAYGYEVGVTALQIAAAYGVIATGGVLYKPSIMKEVVRENGEIIAEGIPQVIRRVVSEETAGTLTDFLVEVVESGTGVGAKVEGVSIAGKTGTARKVVDGKYVPGSYTATFAGFFPAEKPKVVCVVMLDTHSGLYSGGLASAPIFRNIAERVIGLSERFAEESIADLRHSGSVRLPDVINLRTDVAVSLLEDEGFSVELMDEGSFVTGQSPGPGTKISPDGKVTLNTTSPAAMTGEKVSVPDLQNLSVRRAINRLNIERLSVAVRGSGMVRRQTPAPGTRVKAGTTVIIRCQPTSTLAASLH